MLTVLAALEPVLNILKTVLGIGGLIFVHELGHFLVGRWCGVRAEVFSIGFGKAIWKWQPGETEYRIAPIPLGGYVKFLGETPDEDEHSPDSFLAASYPRKAAIMLAGVTMNVIAAFALFVWTFSVGVELPAPVVGTVVHGSPAWEHGVRAGDEIVTVDDRTVLDFEDIIQDTVLNEAVTLGIRRDGELLRPIRVPTEGDEGGVRRIGLGAAPELSPRVRVAEGSDAEAAGLRDGDDVVAFDGRPVESAHEALTAWEHALSGTFTVERDGERIEVALEPSYVEAPMIGVALDALEVGRLVHDGPAALAGLQTGDRPRSLDGAPMTTVKELRDALSADGAAPAVLEVERDGEVVRIEVGDDPEAFAASLAGARTPLVVSPHVEDGVEGATSAAAAAGLTAGSTLLEADGTELADLGDLQAAVAAAVAAERPLALRWRDAAGEERTAELTPAPTRIPRDPGLYVGTRMHVVQETDVVAAVGLGIERTDRWIRRILGTLGSLVTGKVSATNLAGPVAIATHTYQRAETSVGQFLLFLGFISMNLAVLNLLPIPLLDGGQLAMITAERIRGRPLPESVQAGLQWAGLILLLGLMVFVVANDIRKL